MYIQVINTPIQIYNKGRAVWVSISIPFNKLENSYCECVLYCICY